MCTHAGTSIHYKWTVPNREEEEEDVLWLFLVLCKLLCDNALQEPGTVMGEEEVIALSSKSCPVCRVTDPRAEGQTG